MIVQSELSSTVLEKVLRLTCVVVQRELSNTSYTVCFSYRGWLPKRKYSTPVIQGASCYTEWEHFPWNWESFEGFLAGKIVGRCQVGAEGDAVGEILFPGGIHSAYVLFFLFTNFNT